MMEKNRTQVLRGAVGFSDRVLCAALEDSRALVVDQVNSPWKFQAFLVRLNDSVRPVVLLQSETNATNASFENLRLLIV